jgi:hypothetical protein
VREPSASGLLPTSLGSSLENSSGPGLLSHYFPPFRETPAEGGRISAQPGTTLPGAAAEDESAAQLVQGSCREPALSAMPHHAWNRRGNKDVLIKEVVWSAGIPYPWHLPSPLNTCPLNMTVAQLSLPFFNTKTMFPGMTWSSSGVSGVNPNSTR